MGKFQEKLDVRLTRFFDLLMIIVFDLAVFASAVLALRCVIFLASWLFSEETTGICIAKIVSSISVTGGYAFYTVFDLIRYVRTLMREES